MGIVPARPDLLPGIKKKWQTLVSADDACIKNDRPQHWKTKGSALLFRAVDVTIMRAWEERPVGYDAELLGRDGKLLEQGVFRAVTVADQQISKLIDLTVEIGMFHAGILTRHIVNGKSDRNAERAAQPQEQDLEPPAFLYEW